MNKKRIAREWLYFVGCLAIGLIAVPFILSLIVIVSQPSEGERVGHFYHKFYEEMFSGHDVVFFLIIVLGPYLLVQLIRSLVWAWKTVRTQ